MQFAGFVMDHPATHRDRMLQHLIRKTNLLERVNPTGRNCQIDRAPTDNIAFARISASLVEIDIVPAAAHVRGEQTASQTGTDQYKL